MRGFWIKSHVAILNDRKIASLPDNLWRRYNELKHLLPHDAKSGDLPEVRAIAFQLRIPESQLSEELKELENQGLIMRDGDNYILPNFCEEQAADSNAERKRRQREKEQMSRKSHDAVTIGDTEREKERSEQKEESRADESPMAVLAAATDVVVSNCTEADEPDEAFWERMRQLRSDLNINREIEAMKQYLNKKGDTRGITRRFAGAWIRRASPEVKPPSPTKQKKADAHSMNDMTQEERDEFSCGLQEIMKKLAEKK